MTKIFLGIDIGSTTSHALLADENGRILAFSEAGPGNHENVGYDGLQDVLKQLTTEVLNSANVEIGKVHGAGFGVSGYDWSSERAPILKVIHTLGLSAHIELVNDTLLGLVAGSEKGWGIAVVAGSGENCWGRDSQGRIGRMTGRGPLMGEFGGASTIASKAIQAVSTEWSHRGPPTSLTQVLLEVTGAQDRDDLIEGLGTDHYHIGEEITPKIFQVAEEGDIVARGIIAWAANQLATLVNGVVNQLDFQNMNFDVVEMGGVFKGGTLLTEPFHAAVLGHAPGARFISLKAPPVIGAVLLVVEQTNVDRKRIREQLTQQSCNL